MKPLAYQNLTENHEANFRNLSKFEKKLADKKPEPILKRTKTWK